MSVQFRTFLLGSSALAVLVTFGNASFAQDAATTPSTPPSANAGTPKASGTTELPAIQVTAPRRRTEAHHKPTHPQIATTTLQVPSGAAAAPTGIAAQAAQLDIARAHIFSPTGANSANLSRENIQAMPQGTDAPLNTVLLQFPGVSQDSAAAGEFHVRNEHANVQTRINGVALPDSVGGFGQFLDTGIIGNISLLTGALPAQYGLRTAGVLDITTRADAFNNSGSISIYGGSHGTITPSFEYGGTAGDTQYFVSGRYFGSDLGIENPTSSNNAIHDHTDQGKGFAYVSTKLDDFSRMVFIGGTSTSSYQIPNNPGQQALPNLPPPYDSASLNERQLENNQFGVLAYQKSYNGLDTQLSAFTRYSTLHFTPDPQGDLAFNGVSSDVYRRSLTIGISSDNAYRWSDAHTLRFGLQVSSEQSLVRDISTAALVDPGTGDPLGPDQTKTYTDSSSKLGWLISTYASDEWKLTNQLTLTTGLRFDQMYSYTDANQLSPRVNLVYKPFESTTFHAGYARNFTPPPQVLAAPTNTSLANGTTQQPSVPPPYGQVQPERSTVFDVGVTQKVLPGLELGVDAYYKEARNLLDDGQFGAAYVLTAFNYDRGRNVGIEFTGKYVNGNFKAYANLAIAQQKATTITSNQFLFDPADLAYIQSHYIFTDHAQRYSGSAGASYKWNDTLFSANMIFGSGLRADLDTPDGTIPNGAHLPFYTQVNLGVAHDFVWPGYKPLTVRFDVVNVLDSVYEIRDGTGVGVFAPQYGPRRGFFAGLSQKL
ncbi:MAG: ligand-gated channel [Bradyrhizobiaceae bacterium]|nr:MAG: ligand-gated channel [Bradyrhizobiaceae bacterium]